ncbi:MAG: magnesium transporter [Candidatus Woesearchaeota archaeon]
MQGLMRLMRTREYDALRKLAQERSPAEIAHAMHALSPEHAAEVFVELEDADEVFAYLGVGQQQAILDRIDESHTARLISQMSPDDRTMLFEELSQRKLTSLLSLLDEDERAEALMLLGYPEQSVGRLMSPSFVALEEDWTVKRALTHVRSSGSDRMHIEMVYLVDRDGVLIDEVRLADLVLADPRTKVSSLVDRRVATLLPTDDRERAVEILKHYDVFMIPVVDEAGVLLGTVTADDVFDVAELEFTEDVHKAASIAPLDARYSHTGIASLFNARVGWLFALVFVSLASSIVIGAYEDVLASTIALAFFIPLLMATAGNTGSQSATIIVRAIATDDVRLVDWFTVFVRELFVGVLLGVVLGVVTYVLGIFQSGHLIGVVVGLTMLSIIIVSNLLGAVLPFALSKLRIDPAVASAPLITSLADAIGLVIYFGFAIMLL